MKHQNDYDFPVRLLILEREYRQQIWWERLIPATTEGNRRKQALYQQMPYELQLLTAQQQQNVLKSFLEVIDCANAVDSLPDPDDLFWDTLRTLSNNGRPLFIGMAAVAIAHHGLHQIRQWDQQALLDYVLRHEQEAWQRLIGAKDLSHNQDGIFDLLALSSVAAGFNYQVDEDTFFDVLNELALFPNEALLEHGLNLLPVLAGHHNDELQPGRNDGYLQPDFFAEYFVLQQWGACNGKLKRGTRPYLQAVYRLSPDNTLAFLARSAVDFTDDETVWLWWDHLYKNEAADKTPLDELAFSVIGQLRLRGKFDIALQRWLPQLCESGDPQSLARAFNLHGLLNIHLGHYETALDYLKKSLAIQQEIGDKSGEGTTLNNISQIYDARGDYETALDYLKKSLTIRQEIGDMAGLCATLFNMGHIHWQNEEKPDGNYSA